MAKHSKGKRLEKKSNSKKKRFFIIFIILILLVVLIFSAIKIIEWIKSNKQNEELQEKLSNYVEENINTENEEQEYNIDFKSLKEINSDTVGFLKVNNTNIEYIVVKGNDNEYYLNHNFEKEYNVAGWVFADCKNKFNFTDWNIVIYGHNMKNGSIFGTLKDTLKEEWYKNEENRHIILVTEKGTSTYEVFSVYEEKANDYPIQTGFTNDNEYLNFLNTIKDKSIKDFNVNLSAEKGILTLSTCGSNNQNRVILHAIKEN